MFGIASRFDVQIGIVARHALRLQGIVLVIRGQLLEPIEDILTDEVTLLDPSRRAGCGANLDEMAVMVEYFHTVAVFDHSGFFIHRRHVVAEIGLNAGNVGSLQHAFAMAIARRQKDKAKNGT